LEKTNFRAIIYEKRGVNVYIFKIYSMLAPSARFMFTKLNFVIFVTTRPSSNKFSSALAAPKIQDSGFKFIRFFISNQSGFNERNTARTCSLVPEGSQERRKGTKI